MENLASNNDAGGDGSSIVPTIAAWLSSTCSASTCSPIIISQASAEVESQCRTDMSQKSYIPLVAYALLSNYETARNVLCSHASTSKRYCMNQIFTEMEVSSCFVLSYCAESSELERVWKHLHYRILSSNSRSARGVCK